MASSSSSCLSSTAAFVGAAVAVTGWLAVRSSGCAWLPCSQGKKASNVPAKMKAIKCVEYGLGEDCLVEADDVDVPTPGPRQVLVRVTAIAANPVDMKLQRGDFGVGKGGVLGHDAAGVVVATGGSLTGRNGKPALRVGDRVAVFVEGVGRFASNGSYAQYVAAHENLVARVPDNISDEEAAASTLVGLTAYEMVVTHAKVTTGQSVLVTGASGGVGGFVVQLCKALVGPTGRVLVTAGGAKSVQHIKTTLGVHDSEIIRYRGATVEEMVAAVEAANAGHKVDVAFDTFGGDMKRLCLAAAAFGGHVVSIVEERGEEWAGDAVALWNGRKSQAFQRNLSLHFEFLGARALMGSEADTDAYGGELDGLFAQLGDGTLKPPKVTSSELSVATVHSMHTQLAAGVVKGKLTASVKHEE